MWKLKAFSAGVTHSVLSGTILETVEDVNVVTTDH